METTTALYWSTGGYFETSDPMDYEPSTRPHFAFFHLFKWLLRLVCIFIIFLAPWANYKLIELFQTRAFYRDSSAKWYLTFKAVFDTIYLLVSVPIIFSLTFNIDIIHRNMFTCKLFTYAHYFSDDLISIMLTLLCLDRMLRITCGVRLRTRVSLIVCIVVTIFFLVLNVHHLARLQHQNGFCSKVELNILNSEFDIYYSYIYTTMSWSIIFIASVNLSISIYCDKRRRRRASKEPNVTAGSRTMSFIRTEADRLQLIDHTDEWDDPTAVTIESTDADQKSNDHEQQDTIDLQITICVLITSALFLACNLPNFVSFIMRYIYHSHFSPLGLVVVYLSLFPLLFAHTISYFVFKHLAERLFRAPR